MGENFIYPCQQLDSLILDHYGGDFCFGKIADKVAFSTCMYFVSRPQAIWIHLDVEHPPLNRHLDVAMGLLARWGTGLAGRLQDENVKPHPRPKE